MVVTAGWLINKSAYARLGQSPDLETWLTRINRGLVHVSNLTLLQLGFSATNRERWERALNAPPLALLLAEYLTPAMEDRALEVQSLLMAQGLHRAPGIPDRDRRHR